MNTSELKKSNIELVYLYFDSINTDNDGACIDHFAMNLSENFSFTYNYKEKTISMSRNNLSHGEKFWSFDDNIHNISNISLLLGENGAGKTTLMRLLTACNIEHIKPHFRNYILIYYLKDSNSFFVKTTCPDLIKTQVASSHITFNSILYKATENHLPVYGYFGLVNCIKDGKFVAYEPIKKIKTSTELSRVWVEMFPMECIYLPLSNDHNSTRFLSRRFRSHVQNEATIIDILNFFIWDYQNKNYHFIKNYPNLLIDVAFARHAESERYNEILREIYFYLKLGNPSTNYTKLFNEDTSTKISFFTIAMISLLVRLCINLETTNYKKYYTLLLSYRDFANSEEVISIDALYTKTCRDILDIFSNDKAKKEAFQETLNSINNLPDSIFDLANIKGNPLRNFYCKIPLTSISDCGHHTIVDHINTTKWFETLLEGNENTFHLTNYRFSDMSTGEYTLITDVFARIFSGINKIKPAQNKKSILLILDEPDSTLHLRWTQKFVYSLIEFLGNYYPQYTFQIILTSHMPFLVTDFPRTNIFCLSKADWRANHDITDLQWVDGYAEDTKGMRAFHPKSGFMCNYYDLLRDAFFIDVPVGEFAQKKYEQLHSQIDMLPPVAPTEELALLQYHINLIDEPLLRKVLQEKLNEHKDKRIYIDELRKKAQELLTEAEQLEQELKND